MVTPTVSRRANGRAVDGLARRFGEAADDRFGRPLRIDEGGPGAAVEIGEALLVRGREVGEPRRAAQAQRRDRLHPVPLDQRERGGDLFADVVETAGHQILHCRPGAAVGNVRDAGAHGRIEQDGAHVRPRAAAGRSVLHLRLVRFRVGDEFGKRVRWKVLARDEHPRRVRDQGDGRKVGHGVVERLLVQGRDER